jgi:large subunit ribosomal protein L23
MALFGSKKNTEVKSADTAQRSSGMLGSVAHVLKNPRITEKATMRQGAGVYTFDIDAMATKPQIAQALREVYKVSPRKIAIVTIPAKQTRSMRTGRRGVKAGGKKAYVYLKSGESITLA